MANVVGLRFLLVGSYLSPYAINENIATGEYFSINLLTEPFSLARPSEVFAETIVRRQKQAEDKSLLLFAAADLARISWSDMRTRVQSFLNRPIAAKQWVLNEATGLWE